MEWDVNYNDQYAIVKETIDQASQVLGYDLRDLIDNDENEAKSDSLHTTSYFGYIRCHLPITKGERLPTRYGGRPVSW